MFRNDTIVAISSAPGIGRRGIIRLSGQQAWQLARTVVEKPEPVTKAGRAFNINLHHAIGSLPALLLLFQGPQSFTGLDVAELHVPGSPALLRTILEALVKAGARQAEPGEFSAQAFLHGKMDLTEAEGIAATIAATTRRQLRAAGSLREGALHQWTAHAADALANLLALIEAGIDFSDEPGVSFVSVNNVRQGLQKILQQIRDLQLSAVRWERIDQMPTVVLVGKPNVGKSSLINALAGRDRAIVSPVAGTTRDALTAIMETPQGPVRLVDVAGEETSQGEMAERMNAARLRALQEADLVLVVVDSAHGQTERPAMAAECPVRIIQNKSDLAGAPASAASLLVSAKTGANLGKLKDLIADALRAVESQQSTAFTLNQRHRESLGKAQANLTAALGQAGNDSVTKFPELLAADIRAALDALGEISGTIAPDEILGRVFGTFCVGK